MSRSPALLRVHTVLVISTLAIARGEGVEPPLGLGEFAVGHREFILPGATATSDLWYPVDAADAVGDLTTYPLGPDGFAFLSDVALAASPVSREGPFPLLIALHGRDAFSTMQTPLTETLASHGFVVAAPQTSQDVRLVVDTLVEQSQTEGDPIFAAIDGSRVGVQGISAGGEAALASQFADQRVRAIMPISPATTQSALAVPTFLLTGSRDVFAPTTENVYEDSLAVPRYFGLIEDAGHVSFTNFGEMTEFARASGGSEGLVADLESWLPECCTPDHIPNQEAVDLTNFLAVAFFRTHLAGEAEYEIFLTPEFAAANNFPIEVQAAVFSGDTVRQLSPRTLYEVWDRDFDGHGDRVRDTSSGVGEGDVGERELRSTRWLSRLVAKFELPEDARELVSAELRFLVRDIQGRPKDAVSLWHHVGDNDLQQLATDYEDSGYTDTLRDLVGPLDAPQESYRLDVTQQVLSDYAQDGERPLAAFRLELDGTEFPQDGESERFLLAMSGSKGNGPLLVLTFVPEPSAWLMAVICLTGLAAFCARDLRADCRQTGH